MQQKALQLKVEIMSTPLVARMPLARLTWPRPNFPKAQTELVCTNVHVGSSKRNEDTPHDLDRLGCYRSEGRKEGKPVGMS
jgi:hypothetical protein